MSYVPSENGTKVNMIKQKFEKNVKCETKEVEECTKEDEITTKELLRRSLSASPVKAKKNLKLNVTRQLSNPGKNIKRTPAFRGDKLNKIRNLHSPSKEKMFSIVNQNVKIFEETPEYGKIGNVKKKLTESIGEKGSLLNSDVSDDSDTKNCGIIGNDVVDCIEQHRKYNETIKDYRPPFTKCNRVVGENTVRTTVISRQKNISPIYSFDVDDDINKSITHSKDLTATTTTESSSKSDRSLKFNKFLMNGVEYTRVTKSKPSNNDEKKSKFHDNNVPEAKTEITIDIREELSRRKSISNPERNKKNNLLELSVKKPCDENITVELSNCLKAALEAPLPVGPPPKKPPRTFAHSPIIRRYNLEVPEENVGSNWPKNNNRLAELIIKNSGVMSENSCDSKFHTDSNINHSGVEFNNSKALFADQLRTDKESHVKISQDDNSMRIKSSLFPLSSTVKNYCTSFEMDHQIPMTSSPSSSSIKSRSTRDSKKMLEKLETVLIQHQKALGSNVIVPTKDKSDIEMDINSKKKSPSGSESDLEKHQDKRKFYNRLSRTLEDSKKLITDKKNQESKNRKHSTFDCLPYLNCASSTVYKQPNFKTYFNEWSPVELKSKSEDSLDISLSKVLSNNNIDSYDEHMSPAARRLSTELTTFLDSKRRQSVSTKSEERIYAEPYAFDKNKGTDVLVFGELSPEEHNYLSRSWQNDRFNAKQSASDVTEPENSHERKKKEPELHYLCTTIEPLVLEDNNNAPKPDKMGTSSQDVMNSSAKSNSQSHSYLEGANQIKVEELLNQAFGQFTMAGTELSTDSNTSSDTESIASSPSTNDELASFNGKLQLFKNRENNIKPSKEELHRSLTEKRKHYVRRVSVKYSEKCDGSMRSRRDRLFDVCLLVELNFSTKEPYIKDKYPIYAQVPAWIENFCFPDAQDWPPLHSNHNQFYSLSLMDERGNRRYGYCCRVKPEGGPILPLAYCLITKSRASGFYRKVLMELESRHGMPDKRRRNFIEELYNSTMPKPGNSITMTTHKIQITSDNNSDSSNNGNVSSEKTSAAKFMESLNDSNSDESTIMRSGDPRLEERDMSQLFDAISNKILIFLFGSLLLERRVVLTSEKLSKLSSCVEALQSLLYPFTWPHTFIPVLPDIPELSEILHAPLPFVIGILKAKNSANTQVSSVQDGIVVDIDTSKIICAVGDESTILPLRLQKGIRSALQLVSSNTKPGDGMRNFLVSEAFLRVFVETCAHLDSHLAVQPDGKVIFQKESFVNASGSKTVQYFLEWFVETTMFNTFTVDYIAYTEGTTIGEQYNIELFNKRVAEYRKTIDSNKQSKKNSSKKKTLGDRLKDLTNFYT